MIRFVYIFFYLYVHGTLYASSNDATHGGGYALGIEWAPSAQIHSIEYKANQEAPLSGLCHDQDLERTCYASLKPQNTFPIGVVFTKLIQKDGWLFFDSGYNVAFHKYSAELDTNPDHFSVTQDELTLKRNEIEEPLTQMSIDLYAVAGRHYSKLGLTAPYLPDLILSIGPGIELVLGEMVVNKEPFRVQYVSVHFFGNMELGWLESSSWGQLSSYLDIQLNFGDKGALRKVKTDKIRDISMVSGSFTLGLLKWLKPL